jgi:GxxExxY protein
MKMTPKTWIPPGGRNSDRGCSGLVHGQVTERILAAAFEVHSTLGPGLLESVYEQCLCFELQSRGIAHRRQVAIPIVYKEVCLQGAYRADVIVESSVLLELKAVNDIEPIHEAQLLSYLRLTGLRVGLLLNFNVPTLKQGIIRRIL